MANMLLFSLIEHSMDCTKGKYLSPAVISSQRSNPINSFFFRSSNSSSDLP